MTTDVYNIKAEKVDQVTLPESVFARKWNADLVHQVLVSQMANARRPWAHTKDRAEVSGGGKKPWRQKGTGRARHGSIRSPLWKGGGVSFGPRKDRDYTKKVNKKMKRSALFAVLSKKVKDGDVRVIDTLSVTEPKTKKVSEVLTNFFGKKEKRPSVLFVPRHGEKNMFRASANIPKVLSIAADSLNIYDILNHKMLFVDKEAVAAIEKHYKI